MAAPSPLEGWTAYCTSCAVAREFDMHEEVDAATGKPYFEYVCRTCATILMTLTPPE